MNNYLTEKNDPATPTRLAELDQGEMEPHHASRARCRHRSINLARSDSAVLLAHLEELSLVIISIDPGANGAIAGYFDQAARVVPMGATNGDTVAIIRSFTDKSLPGCPRTAYVEELVKHMGAGIPASTMAVYASNWGVVVGALMALGWKVVRVRPQVWQGALGLGITGRQKSKVEPGMSPNEIKAEKKRVRLLNGQLKRDWKSKLRGRAQELYPDTTVTLGNADALLILAYALKVEQGTPKP